MSVRRGGNCSYFTVRVRFYLRSTRETVWRLLSGIERDSIRSASTPNGGSVLFGAMAVQRASRLWTIIDEATGMTKLAKKLKPIFPGEILAEEFMAPHGLSRTGWRGTST